MYHYPVKQYTCERWVNDLFTATQGGEHYSIMKNAYIYDKYWSTIDIEQNMKAFWYFRLVIELEPGSRYKRIWKQISLTHLPLRCLVVRNFEDCTTGFHYNRLHKTLIYQTIIIIIKVCRFVLIWSHSFTCTHFGHKTKEDRSISNSVLFDIS